MAISNDVKLRIAHKLSERNKVARWINDNLNPTSKVTIIDVKSTVDKLVREKDANALEKTIDAFMESPRELDVRGRHSYALPELREMEEIANQSQKKAKEDVEFYSDYVKQFGVQQGGLPSSFIDPIKWVDRFNQFAYDYKDPEEFNRPESYRGYKERLYRKGLGLDYEAGWETKYKANYLSEFEDKVVGQISSPSKKEAAKKVLSQLKGLGGEQFRDLYFLDIMGEIQYLYVTNEEDAMEVAQNVARMFKLDLPY